MIHWKLHCQLKVHTFLRGQTKDGRRIFDGESLDADIVIFDFGIDDALSFVVSTCRPVAFSLMASFMSAITLIGVSNENYQYGTQFIVINISYGLATPICAYLFLPVFYNMRVTSVYEVSIACYNTS